MRVDNMESNNAVPDLHSFDPQTTALHALAWIMADGVRADRMLALTGLDPETLRSGLGNPAVLAALLDHLANHEPDLLACADALGCAPADIVAARRGLAS